MKRIKYWFLRNFKKKTLVRYNVTCMPESELKLDDVIYTEGVDLKYVGKGYYKRIR